MKLQIELNDDTDYHYDYYYDLQIIDLYLHHNNY